MQLILASMIVSTVVALGRLLLSRADAHLGAKREIEGVAKEVAARPPADLD